MVEQCKAAVLLSGKKIEWASFKLEAECGVLRAKAQFNSGVMSELKP
jgi:hypothetical protein